MFIHLCWYTHTACTVKFEYSVVYSHWQVKQTALLLFREHSEWFLTHECPKIRPLFHCNCSQYVREEKECNFKEHKQIHSIFSLALVYLTRSRFPKSLCLDSLRLFSKGQNQRCLPVRYLLWITVGPTPSKKMVCL